MGVLYLNPLKDRLPLRCRNIAKRQHNHRQTNQCSVLNRKIFRHFQIVFCTIVNTTKRKSCKQNKESKKYIRTIRDVNINFVMYTVNSD